jgi:hypothetical protein
MHKAALQRGRRGSGSTQYYVHLLQRLNGMPVLDCERWRDGRARVGERWHLPAGSTGGHGNAHPRLGKSRSVGCCGLWPCRPVCLVARAVARVVRRLVALGCLGSAADGQALNLGGMDEHGRGWVPRGPRPRARARRVLGFPGHAASIRVTSVHTVRAYRQVQLYFLQ